MFDKFDKGQGQARLFAAQAALPQVDRMLEKSRINHGKMGEIVTP